MSAWLPWAMWALGTLLYCYGFFQRLAPGVMVDALMRDLSIPASVLGNLAAIYFYVYAVLQMPAGLLLDRFGARLLLALACATAAAGSALFAIAPDINVAYVGRLLAGFGAGFGWVGALKVIADWFPAQRFAMLSGLSLTVGLIAGLVAQAPLAGAVDVVGWRMTMVATALIGAVLAPVIFLLLRDRRHLAVSAAARGTSLLLSLKRVVAQPRNWLIGAQGMSLNATINAVIGLWGVPFFIAVYQLDRATAAWSCSLAVIGWAVGCPAAGWWSDRLASRRIPMIAGSALALVSLGAIVFLPPLPLVVAWPLLLLYGMGTGASVVAYAAARDVQPPEATGAAVGFANMIAVAGIAAVQSGTGVILDLAWDGTLHDGVRVYGADAYRTALALYPVLIAFGHVLAWTMRETHRGLAPSP